MAHRQQQKGTAGNITVTELLAANDDARGPLRARHCFGCYTKRLTDFFSQEATGAFTNEEPETGKARAGAFPW